MIANYSKAVLRTALSVSMLVTAGLAGAATTVNLNAQRATAALPDGTTIPMWQFCGSLDANVTNDGTVSGGTCPAAAPGVWTPGPTITVPAGDTLNINLTNSLGVPTSIVVLGQLGGGLGTPTKMGGPAHNGQTQTTFPAGGAADIPFTPPAQADRVRSFATEVAANSATPVPLSWTSLRPGTYIYETGTYPSLQVPMGLYGLLIVTQAPGGATFAAGDAYPLTTGPARAPYDSEAALLFSEIDALQNTAVDNAALAGTAFGKRFDDTSCNVLAGDTSLTPRCYPAAVNYTPTYFLINGKSFDITNPSNSSYAVGANLASGNILVRFANAGSHTHIPSIIGQSMFLMGEDGNFTPGNPKIQNEVLLTAGKTVDVLIKPAQSAAGYAAGSFGVFDRQGSLSTGNTADGGAQAVLLVGGATKSGVTPTANPDFFDVPLNTAINGDVRLNDIAVMSATVVAGSGPQFGNLAFSPNGTFIYTPNAGVVSQTDTFTYYGNGNAALTAVVTLNIAKNGKGAAPIANPDSFTSNVAGSITIVRPGVLVNDTDPAGYVLTATGATPGSCSSVTLNTDGSFTATSASATCSFTYFATNSQLTNSTAAATVNLNFGAAGMMSGLNVAVVDAQTGAALTDYRWIIQEDLTYKHDTSQTPTLATRTVGTSFHRSHMNVVASGCVGASSCGAGQSVRGVVSATAPNAAVSPSQVFLDPAKHYYISVLPGDAMEPVITDGAIGHQMGGAEIKPQVGAIGSTAWDLVTIKVQPTPIEPAQLSIYIYEDSEPTNGQNDLNERGLGGFNIILNDAVGRSGDPAGQQTYDMFNMPLSNYLLGQPGCPNELNTATAAATGNNLVGTIYTCPNDPNEGTRLADPAKYTLAGHALIKNIPPARYDVLAHPGASRFEAGEEWWQVETLEGTAAQDAFAGINEPVYFQEFGPPGFHTTIGFVNPARVKAAGDAARVGVTSLHNVTGKITNQHMSHPSDVTLWDSGTYDSFFSTTCRVALNSQGGNGPSIATAVCNPDGTFTVTGVPAGAYQLSVFDQWLDQIVQSVAVTVGTSDVALGNIQVLSWFTQLDLNIYQDLNKNGIYDGNEPGISNVPLTVRYRNGSISNVTLSDSAGNGILVELFPLFNWYVTEADTTRYKQTGVNLIVDTGGPVDGGGKYAGLMNSMYSATPANPNGCFRPGETPRYAGEPACTAASTSDVVEMPGALSYGVQGFISQRNRIDWGRTPYAAGENGGITGYVVSSATRPFDDMRYNVQTIWEPLVPRVKVNLYRKDKLADGSETLTLVDTTTTSSWDDYVNTVFGNDGAQYILGADNILRDPATGVAAAAGAYPPGKQVNMQCPGQRADDPFVKYTLAGQNPANPDQFRCYDGFHNWNQTQAAPYDGRYVFPSADYVAKHPLCSATVTTNCTAPTSGQTLVSLPAGQYVVEAVTPSGWEVVKEEDKNIFMGDVFNAPAVQQFGALGSLFILPDQATLNNANPFNPSQDGFQINATSNLGVKAPGISFPECVGTPHRVPDYLSRFPLTGQWAPFAGMDRPLCDRKQLTLTDQAQSSATFFIFTATDLAANSTGIILDDASSEFNAAAPDFGEKASVPFVPVSIKDWTGMEISRTYADQWGAYNTLAPSSFLVNPPTPSGYGPNMLVTCMNDPGPVPERDANGTLTGKMIVDPQYNAAYSNFCYTMPFMPGQATYLDTPVLPIAAFAAGYNPADCAYPDQVPAIARVDSSLGFGPYLTTAGGTLTIKSQGIQTVPNPSYAGPFATSGPASQRTIQRNYGFGATAGTVKIGNVTLAANWGNDTITATVPANTPTGQLVVTAANGKSTVDAVTVTIEGTTSIAKRVPGNFATIQAAIEAATPGDLILLDAGAYNELVIMWKPVRLQGVGAASVVINAAKFPFSKLATWRPTIDSMFGVNPVDGTIVNNPQVDALPGQEITGGVVLLEPSVLGTEEGAGITVLAKDPSNLGASGCANPALSQTWDAATKTMVNSTHRMAESDFNCAKSRIDGVSVTGGDSGGGIYVNGWAHNLEISNNRVYGNAGALNGGVRIGVPYLEIDGYPGQFENADGTLGGAPTLVGPTGGKFIAGLGYDNNIRIHHNAITKNGVVEGTTGQGGAGGGISICTGTDGFSVDHNWVCGNYSQSDGGGIGLLGYSQSRFVNNVVVPNKISNNTIMFNQTFQQTTGTHGGGIFVGGEPALALQSQSLGTGNLTIDANVIRGNFAEAGHGGGVRLSQVNGADVARFATNPAVWNKVRITNNMIDNNVAGWSGGGVSLFDALVSVIDNNTIVANDSVGIAGPLLAGGTLPSTTTPAGTGKPSPAGISSDPNGIAAAVLNATSLSPTQKRISSPELANNIVWKNRSFFFKVVNGQATLCSSNAVADASGSTCNVLPDQTTTGQCVGTPAYWDLGVLGDVSVAPSVATHLNPTNSILTSTTGYTGAGLSSSDPLLADMYCNGSRVTPEFASVINSPSPKNLAVAATVDEGNNYVSMRFGPLSTTKPTSSTGSAFASFGDYHLAAASAAAIDKGTTIAGLGTDFDGESRPGGLAFDIGADERPGLLTDLSVTKTDGRTAVLRGSTVTYTIVVSNNGPNAVTGAAVTETLPGSAFLSVSSWSCVPASGNSCTASGTGNTARAGTVTLVNGGSATFTLTGSVSTTATIGGSMTNTVSVTVPAGMSDSNAANNSAVDADTIVAPAGTLAPSPLTFVGQRVGTTSAPSTVTFRNTTAASITLRAGTATGLNNVNGPALGFTGSNPTNFAVAAAGTTCIKAAVIPAGGTCLINVTFSPGALGTRTATLNIYAAGSGSSTGFATDAVSGAGVNTPAAALRVVPQSAPFQTNGYIKRTPATKK